MACGPRFATNGPVVVRARPPSAPCASYSTTSRPASAPRIAATNPAMPPPTIVILSLFMSASSSPGSRPQRGREPSGRSAPLVDVEELVRAAQGGDPAAMNALMTELMPYLGRICGSVALEHGDD